MICSLQDAPRLYVVRVTSLAMQMAEQGTQQVTRNIRDNFLLKMANLLMPGAEAISESLSTFSARHRPLPLAAVILSQYAENTSSHVAHAWMRDERWRALLDSLPALPAELRHSVQAVQGCACWQSVQPV